MYQSTIFHGIRKRLGLSLYEYIVAEAIYTLKSSEENQVKGYCDMSKWDIAQEFDFVPEIMEKVLSMLLEKGLIERHPTLQDSYRTTKHWSSNVVFTS